MPRFLLLTLLLSSVFSSNLLLAANGGETAAFTKKSAEVSAVDDQGNLVLLPAPAQRIISLAPNLTEVLFYVGAGEQIVGADEYSNYPEQAKDIIRVNNHAAANYELILSLKPDLVVAWESGNGEQIIGRIRELGLPLFVLETRKMDAIPNLFSRLGRLTGHNETAAQRAVEFTQRLEGLRETYSNQPRVRAFYRYGMIHLLLSMVNIWSAMLLSYVVALTYLVKPFPWYPTLISKPLWLLIPR